jgi:hypothetical protein
LRWPCGVLCSSIKPPRQGAGSRNEKAKTRKYNTENDQQTQQAELESVMIVEEPVVHDAIQDGPPRIEIRLMWNVAEIVFAYHPGRPR